MMLVGLSTRGGFGGADKRRCCDGVGQTLMEDYKQVDGYPSTMNLAKYILPPVLMFPKFLQ
ncbi:MAG: hypothetical protein CM1200mP30_13680 [Pseudomonadota bacterium]|nr:MAG: hypothetical protein CM1200mP30_13680 [Pseudomonadota bacterium]